MRYSKIVSNDVLKALITFQINFKNSEFLVNAAQNEFITIENFSLLIEAGADVNFCDIGGNNPLMIYLKTKAIPCAKIVKFFIDAGTEIN